MKTLLCDFGLIKIINMKKLCIGKFPDFKKYEQGEMMAYNEIMEISDKISVEDFCLKYLHYIKENVNQNNDWQEEVEAYNNTIVEILSLINPKFKFSEESAIKKDKRLIKNFTFTDIINAKIDYLELADKNTLYIDIGGKNAFNEILTISSKITIDDFFDKYTFWLDQHRNILSKLLYVSNVIATKEEERLMGYSYAVIDILKLVKPEYDFI